MASGVRIALRTATVLVLPVTAVVGLSENPSGTVTHISVAVVAGPPRPSIIVVLAALSLGVASWAAPRIFHGLTGWVRHLPVAGTVHRRAAVAATAVAQIPLLVLAGLMAAGVLIQGEVPLSPAKVAGLPVMALAAALTAAPVRRRWILTPLGVAAAMLSLTGAWSALLGAVALVAAADLLSGPIRQARPPRPSGGWGAGRLPLVVGWRALRWRVLLAFPLAAAVLGGCHLFVSNNAMSPRGSAAAVGIGSGLAATLVLAGLSSVLSARRPFWPWARSLPWTAGRRVGLDAVFLGLHAAPVIPVAALMDLRGALIASSLIPLLSLRAATAMRTGTSDVAGAAGRVAWEGFNASCLVGVLPWMALGALAAVPFALRLAAREERRLKVTRWSALHHRASGDPLSWSGG